MLMIIVLITLFSVVGLSDRPAGPRAYFWAFAGLVGVLAAGALFSPKT